MVGVLFRKMWICLLYLGTVLAVPVDEFRAIVHEGELSMNDDVMLKQIVPSGYSPQIISESTDSRMPKIDDKDNENFKNLLGYVEKGVTEKGFIFNVYDDDMRNAAIALFRILRDTRIYNRMDYERLKIWASTNVNDDMFDYAKRLTALYSSTRGPEEKFLSPFIFKPNYFVNGETIMKAMFIKNNNGKISENVLKNYQVFRVDDKVVINSNYSGWNIPLNGCDKDISYFKDDAMLNSYYYGIHLQHPFWMGNEELDEMNPKHAEHFYYKHQQLLARYRLEKEHLGTKTAQSSQSTCEPDYNPYLYYENGLAFPTRSSILGDMRDDITRLKSIDIAIKECIYRGVVFMENGTFIKVTPDNYIGLMTKLIRANLDGIKSAKIVRSIFGYGNGGYPVNRSNPTPSLLHHPQTTLRDPVYWFLMERGLEYYSEYTNNSEPINISKYETDSFKILKAESTKLVTNFEFNLINLNAAVEGDKSRYMSTMYNNIYARQRRLNHLPFTMNITVASEETKDVIVRLFLGPRCGDNCWDLNLKFFELDCYRYTLKEGLNVISWNPETSAKYVSFNANAFEDTGKGYNVFKFPKNLVLPKGLEEGLNLTAFVMITEDDSLTETIVSLNPTLYQQFSNEVDTKPLGFPFHKQADLFSDSAPNYRFFNVTVFHSQNLNVERDGYFSAQLY